MICLKLPLKAKNTFGWPPEPPEVSGGAPCQTDMDCIERVKSILYDAVQWWIGGTLVPLPFPLMAPNSFIFTHIFAEKWPYQTSGPPMGLPPPPQQYSK